MSPVPFMTPEPTRDDVGAMRGAVLLEFGVDWCPHCQVAQPLIADVLKRYPEVRHLRIEDGQGRRLGRAFAVKFWPALIFLRDGVEVARIIRPTVQSEVDALFSG